MTTRYKIKKRKNYFKMVIIICCINDKYILLQSIFFLLYDRMCDEWGDDELIESFVIAADEMIWNQIIRLNWIWWIVFPFHVWHILKCKQHISHSKTVIPTLTRIWFWCISYFIFFLLFFIFGVFLAGFPIQNEWKVIIFNCRYQKEKKNLYAIPHRIYWILYQ